MLLASTMDAPTPTPAGRGADAVGSCGSMRPRPRSRDEYVPDSLDMPAFVPLAQVHVQIWRKGEVARPSALRGAKNQRRIGAAEAEGVRQRHAYLAPARLVRHEIDRRFDRGIVEVDGGRCDLIAHCEYREDRFNRAGGAEEVPDGGFRGRHRRAARRIAEQALHRAELDFV